MLNTDIAEGKWKQLKGRVQEQWGELTDDELDAIAGRRERFVGKLQEKHGVAREEAEKSFEALKRELDS